MIRLATIKDKDSILEIYEHARSFMRSYGSSQWQDGYPSAETVNNDLAQDALYVYEEENKIIGVMSVFDYESTYEVIDGKWLSEKPYKVIHRIATHKGFLNKGIARQMINYTLYNMNRDSIRIDTHELNIPMKRLLDQIGFSYCGVIKLDKPMDNLRLAYQKDK